MKSSTCSQSASSVNLRQTLLSVLSFFSLKDIQLYWEKLAISPTYEMLKPPEVGMVMVQAQTGGTGAEFNMGEMTVTRTVIRLDQQGSLQTQAPSGDVIGYGYTAGRNKPKSELIALIDACFQLPQYQPMIEESLLQPLIQLRQQLRQQQDKKVETTKVNFFTMVRGE